MKKKLIILIGGVAGSGKTTLSNSLMPCLGIDHHIGTGFLREILRPYVKKEEYPELFTYSFRPPTPNVTLLENWRNAEKAIKPAVEACLRRAREEGTSLIIEGVYLIPGSIDKDLFDFYFFLQTSDDEAVYKEMISGLSHFNRKLEEADLENNKKAEKELLDICRKTEAIVIPPGTMEERKKMMLGIINKKLKGEKNG